MNGIVRGGELRDVRAHAVAAVRRDDAERDCRDVADAIVVRAVHRAGMKGGDLIVVEIGDDERLRGVRAGHGAHAVGGDAEAPETLAGTARRRRRAVAMTTGSPPIAFRL